ncbi:HEPN domain-containing protein [Candidatus Gottesmanbacteria bacterium]|nr:HEPN domain-containing protein [Candidatus Gottesmanbacteria bacterium]
MTTIEYWKTSSKDDLDTAKKLFEAKKYHHSLFFVHLALEKILKAIHISMQKQAALPIHDLVRLAEKATVKINPEVTLQLAEISTFNVAARYDDYKFKFYKKATREYARKWLAIGNKLYTVFLQKI